MRAAALDADAPTPPPVGGASLACDVTHLAVSGDQLTLMVVTTRQGCPHAYLYDTRVFSQVTDYIVPTLVCDGTLRCALEPLKIHVYPAGMFLWWGSRMDFIPVSPE